MIVDCQHLLNRMRVHVQAMRVRTLRPAVDSRPSVVLSASVPRRGVTDTCRAWSLALACLNGGATACWRAELRSVSVECEQKCSDKQGADCRSHVLAVCTHCCFASVGWLHLLGGCICWVAASAGSLHLCVGGF